MSIFAHQPDGYVYIDTSVPLPAAWYAERHPDYSLPDGMVRREYMQGQYHRLFDGVSVHDGGEWSLGDRLIASAADDITAYLRSLEVPPSLDAARVAARGRVNAARDQAIYAPVEYMGRRWDATFLARANVAEALAAWTAGRELQRENVTIAGFDVAKGVVSWRDADNEDVDLNYEQLVGLAAVMQSTKLAAHLRARELKDSVVAQADTIDALEAVSW